MGGLLDGIRVLDLTNVLAGPFCGYQLAQLGAQVIKIEMPGEGDLARQLGASPDLNRIGMGASFLAQNAGKQSIALDLKQPQGKAVFLRLVTGADVVLENFRPGVMERLGLGYEVLRQARPALVYCAISGFGQTGPLRDNPAYDQIVQGMSGIMSITGDAQSAPLRVGSPVSDVIGGLTAAFAICAALVRARTQGQGESIDVSMLDSTLVTLGWQVSNFLIAGVEPQPMGNENMTAAPSGTFRAKDGPLNIAANKQEQFEALARLIGREDLLADPRFREREARKAHRAELTAEIERALAGQEAAVWAAQLNAVGVPAGPVLSVPEVLAHPHVAARELVTEVGAIPGREEPLRVVRAGFRLASGDPRPHSPPPRLGEHTLPLLETLGFSEDEISQLLQAGIIFADKG